MSVSSCTSVRLLGLTLLLITSLSGCQQMQGVQDSYERPAGVDGTFDLGMPEEQRGKGIAEELAAPKGFFRSRSGPLGGWSSESREIERSLGVKR
ncbi:MAG: hypothetical protein RJA81_1352 [Planctomycetota bacterium]|jgi:hypothetical protein